jgi:hypothetical protein
MQLSQSNLDLGNQSHLLRVLEPTGVQFRKQQAKILQRNSIFYILPCMKLRW